MSQRPDLSNMQGWIAHHFPCPVKRVLLLSFPSQDVGKTLLRRLLPLVTTATSDPAAESRPLAIGLTATGMARLVPLDVMQEFPSDFLDGPDAKAQGDGGSSAPENWWAQRFQTSDVDVVLLLFAKTDSGAIQEARDELDVYTDEIRNLVRQIGGIELFPNSDGTAYEGTSLGDKRLHFGYRDGISEPDVDWTGTSSPGSTDFRHFVLGYESEEIRSSPWNSGRPGAARAIDIARDGSYAVFRVLHQDVAGFQSFLRNTGPVVYPELSVDDAEELLAAKLLGRWRDGAPLMNSPDSPDPALRNDNAFAYAADPVGDRCPVAAHIRVTNPRDQPLNPTENGVPRVLRRGLPFGPELQGREDDGVVRGLLGAFLCTSVSRQYYTLTDWMQKCNFSPVFQGQAGQRDFLGNSDPGTPERVFHLRRNAAAQPLSLLSFTKTLGTAILLLPGIRGLRELAKDGNA